jgi:predicted transcriptional regulator of viral defense system
MATVLEYLELEQPSLVTSADLSRILFDRGIATPTRVVAARLREKGWLLATEQRGVWEFIPAAVAGSFSSNDPLLPLRSFLARHPHEQCALTFQAAAWALGFASRIPVKLEVAMSSFRLKRKMPDSLSSSVFSPNIDTTQTYNVPVLTIESILVHMASRPSDVRSWSSALEWFPELAAEASWSSLKRELTERTSATCARTGYLLQGVRPDLAGFIGELSPPRYKTWFGPRARLRRHDNHWQIADTLLPFNPKDLEATR